MERCGECGFDWDSTGPAALVEQLTVFPRRYRVPLTRFLPGEDGEALVRARSVTAAWSALEYAGHAGAALEFYEARIARVLAEDRPQLTSFDFDAACAAERYNERPVEDVLGALTASAEALAARVADLDDAAWARVGIGSDGHDKTVLLLVRRAVHEGQHHLLDIGRGLRGVRGRA